MIKKLYIFSLILALVITNISQFVPKVAFAAASNLITNPSVETVNSNNPNLPQNWNTGYLWGDLDANYTYPSTGQDGSRSVKVSITRYVSGDAKWYFNPVVVTSGTQYIFSDYYISNISSDLVAQFDDGAGHYSYQYLATLPAASSWVKASTTVNTPNNVVRLSVFHTISSVGTLQTDNFSLSLPSTTSVQITSPTNGSNVTGSVVLSATASDSSGISNIQFKLDGQPIGPKLNTNPYTYTWDSSGTTSGSHQLIAEATANSGSVVGSTPITIVISNTTGNLVPNPSVESPNSSNTAPLSWQSGTWGTNTAKFTYLTTGHTGSRSVKVQVSNYSSGDAKWYFNSQPITAGGQYQFTDYYQSTVVSQVVAAFTLSNGSNQYLEIGSPDPSSSWTMFKTQFFAPSGVTGVTIFHLLNSNGTLTLDDASLRPYTPTGLNRALVTLTFDDGWETNYTNVLPLLNQYGYKSTQYIISGAINAQDDGYMSAAEIQALKNAGNEIASHTVTHPDLTTLTIRKIDSELANSQITLQKTFGVSAADFALPYGAYNSKVITEVQKYYQSCRTVDSGYNSKDSIDFYRLKVQNVEISTTPAQVRSWINQAISTKTWLILVYHQVDNANTDQYGTTKDYLAQNLADIKSSGITVETIDQAITEIKSQL